MASLRARIIAYLRAPTVSEIDFLHLTGNHGKLCANLRGLGHNRAAGEIRKNALLGQFKAAELRRLPKVTSEFLAKRAKEKQT